MKATLLLLAAAVVFCGSAFAAKTSGASPSKTILWSVDPATGGLYLVPNGGGTSKKLCDISSTANLAVHFSPDERFIFITDGYPNTTVKLYKRSSGLSYSRTTPVDFVFAAQRLALEAQTGTKISSNVLSSSTIRCLGWTKNGNAILELSGRGRYQGRDVQIGGFQCVYDPATVSFAAKGR